MRIQLFIIIEYIFNITYMNICLTIFALKWKSIRCTQCLCCTPAIRMTTDTKLTCGCRGFLFTENTSTFLSYFFKIWYVIFIRFLFFIFIIVIVIIIIWCCSESIQQLKNLIITRVQVFDDYLWFTTNDNR